MEAASNSKTLVTIYQHTWHYGPEDLNLNFNFTYTCELWNSATLLNVGYIVTV